LWQHHRGSPSRNAYHNKEWAAKMREVGLVPSSTGKPGGKETGQSVSHYVKSGGAFARACARFTRRGFTVPYVERWRDEATSKIKAASKSRFTCPGCQAKAWGKPALHIVCGDCGKTMVLHA
jgi:hypothetical protein